MDKIIKSAINDFIVAEASSRRKQVSIVGYNTNNGRLYANDLSTRECIPLDIQWSKNKIKKFTTLDGQGLIIKNMPQNNNTIIFCGAIPNQRNNFYGFNSQYELVSFYVYNRQFISMDTNQPINVMFFPKKYMNNLINPASNQYNNSNNNIRTSSNNNTNNIINVNEENPLSKAIERLVANKTIKNDRRAYNLINELMKYGL